MAINILLVCTGNTCRSAMAHWLLKDLAAGAGRGDIEVRSAGVAAYPGAPASDGAGQVAEELGVNLAAHQSSPLTVELVAWADLLLVMEGSHRQAIVEVRPDAAERVQLLSAYGERDRGADIADPVGGSTEVYRATRDRIVECLRNLLGQLPVGQPLERTLLIGADHRGYELKEAVAEYLRDAGWQLKDVGTNTQERCDYPVYAFTVAEGVSVGRAAQGILICSNGVGMSIAANKVPGIRAGLCWLPEIAENARKHNDINVLCLPGDYLSAAEGQTIVDTWLSTAFAGGRYAERVGMLEQQE